MSIFREPIVLCKEVCISWTRVQLHCNYTAVSVTGKSTGGKEGCHDQLRDYIVVEFDYHQGKCALREREREIIH